MNEIIAKLLNEQINKELYSAYLYLDIANYYDSLDLDGYANYYLIQAQEERDHALLFMNYRSPWRPSASRIRHLTPSLRPWRSLPSTSGMSPP